MDAPTTSEDAKAKAEARPETKPAQNMLLRLVASQRAHLDYGILIVILTAIGSIPYYLIGLGAFYLLDGISGAPRQLPALIEWSIQLLGALIATGWAAQVLNERPVPEKGTTDTPTETAAVPAPKRIRGVGLEVIALLAIYVLGRLDVLDVGPAIGCAVVVIFGSMAIRNRRPKKPGDGAATAG